MKYDAPIYREGCPVMDKLFKEHGDKALAVVNRYLRIRKETLQTEHRIASLEAELKGLKKVESLARKKQTA